MSKTDKTRPAWVQAQDAPCRYLVAEHRCAETGVCTLPERPASSGGPLAPGACYWSFSVQFGVDHRCGCRLCSGWYWRRADRRRDRHQAKQVLRSATVEQADEWAGTRARRCW